MEPKLNPLLRIYSGIYSLLLESKLNQESHSDLNVVVKECAQIESDSQIRDKMNLSTLPPKIPGLNMLIKGCPLDNPTNI